MPAVLVGDTDPDTRRHLQSLLTGAGYQVETAASAGAVLHAVDSGGFALVILDAGLADEATTCDTDCDLLAAIAGRDDAPAIVVVTGSADAAAAAVLDRGARDVIHGQCDDRRLLARVRTQIDLVEALRREQHLEAEAAMLRPPVRPMLVADAPAMKRVVAVVMRVAASGANVLITGEAGTGKATLAHAIHAFSSRAGARFIALAASTMSAAEIEAALAGEPRYPSGSGAGEQIGALELADGGTLFVDEVASVPPHVQSQLLRAIETGEFERAGPARARRVSLRVISSTTANLHAEAASGRFRRELLLRLGTVEIALPPLRERREDIPALAHQFLRQHSQRYRKHVTGFEHAAMQAMLSYEWPGNIGELDHAVERAVLTAAGTAVCAGDLGVQRTPDPAFAFEQMPLERAEAFLIANALARVDGNVSRAAKALGLSRSALYRRLQRYGLTPAARSLLTRDAPRAAWP